MNSHSRLKRSDCLEGYSLKELHNKIRIACLKNLYSRFSIEALITKSDGLIQLIVNYYD